MKAFADLYLRLDSTTSSNSKLAALIEYFKAAGDADAAWAVFFLAGGRPKRLVSTKALRELALQSSGLSEWLFEESYQAVGDLAETISLLLPRSAHSSSESLASWVDNRILLLRGKSAAEIPSLLQAWLDELERPSQMVFIKLITGSFRVGVSRLLATRALAAVASVDSKRIAERMVGYLNGGATPSAEGYRRLIAGIDSAGDDDRQGQPYPFFLAHPLLVPPSDELLGTPEQWLVEWKFDGIRAQLIKRRGQVWVWSRGEELVTDRFPELSVLGLLLPDGTVLDGEIVVWKGGRVQPFSLLQQRIGRKGLSTVFLAKVPVALMAYDLLEWMNEDWRGRAQAERRAQLEVLVATGNASTLQLSPLLSGESWEDLRKQREGSRERGVEGLMLKSRSALYGVGRTKDEGVWWKWKIDPFTVDAVLIYAQRGHGRRASLYTDFTFAVWDAPEGAPERKLVPFAKAYSGLTDEEMRRVDAVVRKTTISKFGPVRSVAPSMVFELGFEGIALSSRHKSGIAVRFPRILRWREDKPLGEADTLESLRALLPVPAGS